MSKFNKGEPVSAGKLNGIDRDVRRLVLNDRRRGQRTGDGSFIGEIVSSGPNGEADYADSRYWVKADFISNETGDATAKITLDPYESPNPFYQVVTATNFSEFVDDTHGLAVGTPVRVYREFDSSNPAKPLYYLEHGGGGSLPEGQYMGMHYMMTSQNQSGFSYPFFGAYIG